MTCSNYKLDHNNTFLFLSRHLNLSLMVAAAITTAGETIERAKALKKFIELASLLQSGTYGNLFSFMAVMKGLASPQVCDK